MADKKTYLVGFLTIVILASGIVYVSLDNLKIRVDSEKTTFYTLNENNRFVVSGREINSIFEGSSKMNRNRKEITVNTTIEGNNTVIVRETPYLRGALIRDTYTFRGDIKDIEQFPVSHKIEVINGDICGTKGCIFSYEVRDLIYTGETKKLKVNEMSFGRNMKVEWDNKFYYAKIYKYKGQDKGKLTIKYRIKKDYEVFYNRLFDPASFSITLNSPANETITNDNTPDFNFTVSGNQSSYLCELFINGSGYGKTEKWYSNSDIVSGLVDIGTNSAQEVYEKNSTWHLISGDADGTFHGYQWNGTSWVENSSVVSGLGSVGTYSTPEVYYKDSIWYLISGEYDDDLFYGFQWNGSSWISNSSIVSGLVFTGYYPVATVYQKDSIWHLINGVGYDSNYGYQWNGSSWVENSSIVLGLGGAGSMSFPTVYQKDSTWYLINGVIDGGVNGYQWNVQNNTPTIITANHSITPDGVYNWYINCTTDGTTNQSEIRQIQIGGITNLTLDGLSEDRYYEHGTVCELKANVTNSTGSLIYNATGNNICLNIDQVGYGDDFICGNGSVSYNLTTNAVKNSFNDSSTSKNLTYTNATENKTFYLNFNKYDEIQSAYINLAGYENTSYPTNVKIYVNDTFVDSIFGQLSIGNQTLTEFNNSNTEENLSFSGSSTKKRYLKIPKTANITSAYLDLKGYAFATWNLYAYSYHSIYISTQCGAPMGLFFKSDGNKLYEIYHLGKIYQYSCSDAWNLSSCTYDSIYISTQDLYPTDLFFKSDGSKLYEVGVSSDKIYQYSCSDAWNLSSCSYDSVSISTQDTKPTDLFFKSDGSKLYEVGVSSDKIYQYSCSDAWNLSSCTYDSIYISTQDREPHGLFFKSDGNKLYEIGDDGNKIYQYSCSDAWNLSSCTYDSIYISTQDLYPTDLFFKSDGNKLYEIGTYEDKIYQYTINPPINPYIQSADSSGVHEWNHSGEFNTTDTANLNATLINTYLSSCSADSEGYCFVPLLFYSGSAGILEVSNIEINYTYTIDKKRDISASTIQTYLDNSVSGFHNVPIKISSETNTIIQVDNINITYYGSDNISVTAHFDGDGTYSASNDTQIISVVYSNFNISLPSHYLLDELIWSPESLSEKNCTPWGQSSSVPGWNLTSLAYDQAFNLSIKTNLSFPACMNMTVDDDNTKSGGILINTSYQTIITNFSSLLDTKGIFWWLDLSSCNRTSMAYIYRDYFLKPCCMECVCD